MDLCRPCHDTFPTLGHTCFRCGIPLPAHHSRATTCGRCYNQPPFIDQTQVFFPYEFSVAYLIRQLKFAGNLAAARLMGQLIAEKIASAQTESPQCLIPVPLHHGRYRERGFNQSEEIARVLAATLSLKLDTTSCQRVKPTPPQSSLSASKRHNNLKNAFVSELSHPIRQVAIIDDVITTGSTVNALAQSLRQAGVEHIQVWAFARA